MMIVSGVQSHSGAKFGKRTKPEKVQSGTFLFCSMQSSCLEISEEYLVAISPIRYRPIHYLLFAQHVHLHLVLQAYILKTKRFVEFAFQSQKICGKNA